MKNFIILILFTSSSLLCSHQAFADIKWTSKMVYDMLSDECKRKVNIHKGNKKSMQGGDHHIDGKTSELNETTMRRGEEILREDCGVVLTKTASGKFKLRWAPSSIMNQIDWK